MHLLAGMRVVSAVLVEAGGQVLEDELSSALGEALGVVRKP